MITFEASLSRQQFIRLAVLRHFQRLNFYLYASLCAMLSAYALLQGAYLVLLAAWVPFLCYIGFGVFGAWRASTARHAPIFLRTRYVFGPQGVELSTRQGRSQLGWEQFAGWRQLIGCYVLMLKGGSILAIPQDAVPKRQVAAFEQLLSEQIGGRR